MGRCMFLLRWFDLSRLRLDSRSPSVDIYRENQRMNNPRKEYRHKDETSTATCSSVHEGFCLYTIKTHPTVTMEHLHNFSSRMRLHAEAFCIYERTFRRIHIYIYRYVRIHTSSYRHQRACMHACMQEYAYACTYIQASYLTHATGSGEGPFRPPDAGSLV